jgi:hypothetical protein
LTFDRAIHAKDGCVTGVSMKPMISNNINGFANASINNERIFDINHLHKLFGHCGQKILNKTIKMYGFQFSGSFDTCEQCAIAKTRQKSVNKQCLGSSNLPGELPTGFDKVKLIENATKETEDESNKSDKKVFRAMRKLESLFNPEATKAVEDYSHGREITFDQVNLALFSTVTVKESITYEAIKSEKKEYQIKWKSAINKELKEMEKRGVWEIIDERNIPINRQCIKNKWIFKVKRNGIF